MLSRIFLAVAGMSANAGLLVLAILAVRLVTRRRMPKWGNCLLWGLVAVCLMCPVLPESVLSVRPQPGQAALPAAAAMETASPGAGITLTDLVWVWLVGMAAVLGWAAVSYLRLRRQVAASIRVGKQVYLCDDISSPFILGIFRPRVYLPSGLEGETLQSVLRHEGAHLRRRDHWWKPLGHLLVAVYWFHPLIWAAYVLLCRDIELACDERVVRDMNRAQRAAYSQALLDCAMPRRRRLVLCPLAFGEVGVRDRVKSVLHYRRPGQAGDGLWSAGSIGRLLKNPVYAGTMVQGRQEVVSYKVHETRAVPEGAWFVVENTHPPLIPPELIRQVQARLRQPVRRPPGEASPHLFAGLLRCAGCGGAMSRKTAKGFVYYTCSTHRRKSKTACTPHTIRADRLRLAVAAQLGVSPEEVDRPLLFAKLQEILVEEGGKVRFCALDGGERTSI